MFLEQKIKELLVVASLTTLIGCTTTKQAIEYNPIKEKLPKHIPQEITRTITEYNYDSSGTKNKITKQFGQYYLITTYDKNRIKVKTIQAQKDDF
jgi:hypothetical protein